MNKKRSLAIFLGIFTLFFVQLVPIAMGLEESEGIPSSGKIILFGKGVNYLSLYNSYSSRYTTDDILHRDFSRFYRDGIHIIGLSLFWYRLEGNLRGSYRDDFLDDVKRVIGIAHEHGIRVLVTIHTLWGNDSSWCTPDYVIDPVTGYNFGLAIVRSEDMRQAFIEMVNHTVQYLAGTPGIWAWAILNEPWYWPHDLPPPYSNVDQKESFIYVIQKTSDIVKNLDGRPVTIRFINPRKEAGIKKNIFVDDWGWDQRIFDALDFISFSAYIPEDFLLRDAWRNMTTGNVVGCLERNKRVFVTEFGFNSDDDSIQSQSVRETLEFYKTLPIDGWMAWMWRADSPLENPGLPGKGFNICANATTGEGRPAYYELVQP